MENRKRPGFTLLETVMSISFISLFLVLIIYIPVQLVSEYKNFDDKISNTESVINVFRSFSKDISDENGKTISNGNSLIIGDTTYSFSEDGLNRKKNSSLKISDIPVNHSIENNKISIEILDADGDVITFDYNLGFSSFPNEEDSNE